jgi:hypothetical protein
MRRGRRHPDQLEVGDILDCWQVEACDANHRLLLAARMKLPGRAWLEFLVDADDSNSVIRQTAVFDPRGLLGRAYWYVSWPVHRILFAGMLKQIGRVARGGSQVVV